MPAVREHLIYGLGDAHKHVWPIHYHLLKNDFLAAIDAVRRGANPLVEDCEGTSALALCYKLFFRTINRSLASTAPLGNRVAHTGATPSECPGSPKPQESSATPELRGMADYNLPRNSSAGVQQTVDAPLLTSFIESFIADHKAPPALAVQNALVRRAKGLLGVLRAMADREDMILPCKAAFLQAAQSLGYPALYASVMDYLFVHQRQYGKQKLDAADVWGARCLWRAAGAKDAKMRALTEFIAQIATVLEGLFELFHVDIYSQSLSKGRVLYPGHDRQLLLPATEFRTVEALAHAAFVCNRALLFDAVVLQESFLQGDNAFRWNDLLSRLIEGPGQLKAFMEPLMRRSLRNNVERQMRSSADASLPAVY